MLSVCKDLSHQLHMPIQLESTFDHHVTMRSRDAYRLNTPVRQERTGYIGKAWERSLRAPKLFICIHRRNSTGITEPPSV